jgi:hypothetical protein
MHAHHAGEADGHLGRVLAVQVGHHHIGDSFVRLIGRRVADDALPLLVKHVDLPPQRRPGGVVAMALSIAAGAQEAHRGAFGQIEVDGLQRLAVCVKFHHSPLARHSQETQRFTIGHRHKTRDLR